MAEKKSPSESLFAHLPDEVRKMLESMTGTRSPHYRTVSSNVFRTRLNIGEATIIFSRLYAPPGISAVSTGIEEEVEVVMSWAQMKMLQITLGSIVKAIEEEAGEIKLSSAFKENYEGQREAIKTLYGKKKA